jgi:hypothetical protein
LTCDERVTWSLTLIEEHRLRVVKNGVLRRIFGPKREQLAGTDNLEGKVHSEDLGVDGR